LDPRDVTRARVLEIGCAAAGNLIPFAATHPLARTVGIDLSQVHIDQGRRRVRALGLDNVELMHGDVAHLDLAAVGQFDFIICHGVYSWVPDEVQDAILAACGQLLSPAGVAYVGYNTYPGWKAKEIVRDAMLLSAGDSATIDEKVRRAQHGRLPSEGGPTRQRAGQGTKRLSADGHHSRRLLPSARGTGAIQRAVLLPRLR
jgi:SAM-dependent methyltransferase